MKVVKHSRAMAAIVDEASYLLDQGGDGLADRFVDAVESTISMIAEAPGIGRVWDRERVPGIRAWRVEGFPNHLVFYRVRRGGIEIVHVLHAARDVSYWLRDAGA